MPKLARSSTTASQRDQAYRALHRLLILQQIEPGQRLREPQWAERIGVHRSALREAFARLEAEGLVERGSQTGYFVPRLTQDDVIEVTKLRLALESLAIDEICACRDAPPTRLEPLERAIDEFAQFAGGRYFLGAIEADRRFHEALIEAAGLRRLSTLYHRAPLPLIHGNTEDARVWQEACDRTLSEHRQILAAMKRGDADEAKRVLRSHVSKHPTLPICH